MVKMRRDGKLVSVIVPAYNAEKYIQKNLKSILAQSYGNLQIILVDDGSKDGTLEFAKECAQNDNRLTVIHKENGGVSSARNIGLEHIKGEYVFFVDSDDTIEDNAIEVLVKAMEDSGSDWVNCQYSRWDDSGNRLDDYNFIKGIWNFSSDDERLDFITENLLKYYIGFEVFDKLFRADIIKDNNIKFSEKCRIGEDLAFNLKYAMYAKQINCIDDRCVRYAIHEDSAMGRHKELSRILSENILLLEDVYEYSQKARKAFYIDKFLLICVRVMDNSYIGHTPSEIMEVMDKVTDVDFLASIYRKLSVNKSEIIGLYPVETAKIKYRYHQYIQKGIEGFSISDRLEILIYDLYRGLRQRPLLKDWRMPY